ncbi:MAG: phosphoribosyltransferase [Candidatus Methanomethylicus sp.]|nr:phosphoribosyltransferase [Candidatus Methanomethylicus sp.]
MNILTVTWDDVQSSLLTLADKITASGFTPDMIVGVARGGWVVARILSDLLDVSDLASVKISFYKGLYDKSRMPVIVQPVSESPKGKRVLVVDDVADSGESLLLAKSHIIENGARDLRTATLHLKPWSKIVPDYYIGNTESWILYPWELRETLGHLIRIWAKETHDQEVLKSRLLSAGIPASIIERYLSPTENESKE